TGAGVAGRAAGGGATDCGRGAGVTARAAGGGATGRGCGCGAGTRAGVDGRAGGGGAEAATRRETRGVVVARACCGTCTTVGRVCRVTGAGLAADVSVCFTGREYAVFPPRVT